MKIAKIFFIILYSFNISFFFNSSLAQIKPSCNDIIVKYILSIGNVEKVNSIHSLKALGSVKLFSLFMEYEEYVDSVRYYLNVGNDSVKFIKLVINGNTRWLETEMSDSAEYKDLSGDNIQSHLNKYFIHDNYLKFFLFYDKYGLEVIIDTTSANEDEDSNYTIKFFREDSLKYTAVFNKYNYHLQKYIIETPETSFFDRFQIIYNYNDYKPVSNYGITLPFKIKMNYMINVNIDSYHINETIKDSLFMKPR
jgi:hypothetical protein